MSHSWELTDEQKKEINEKNKELASQFDPETGKRKKVESTDDEPIERQHGGGREGREPKDDDDNIR